MEMAEGIRDGSGHPSRHLYLAVSRETGGCVWDVASPDRILAVEWRRERSVGVLVERGRSW
jgi:hypothetical protein